MGVPPKLTENSVNQRSQKLKAGWSCRSCNASCHTMRCHINPLDCSNKTHPSISDTASLSTLKGPENLLMTLRVLLSYMNTKGSLGLGSFGHWRDWNMYCFLIIAGLKRAGRWVSHTAIRIQPRLNQNLRISGGLFGHGQSISIKPHPKGNHKSDFWVWN